MQTQVIPIAGIQVPPDRQRTEFDPVAILELAQSIKKHGLFHAIQINPLTGNTLVSGERRLRAIKEHLVPFNIGVTYNGEKLPAGHVPVVLASSSDPLALEEIELAENLDRRDLTWQEMAKTTARLHALRTAQKQALHPAPEGLSVPAPEAIQTIADTAREVRGSDVGAYQEDTRREIILAQHLDKPEVAGAASLRDAFKALKKIEDAERNRALAVAVGSTYKSDIHEVFHGNCLELMRRPEFQGVFDVILTDPPYGMGADEFGDGAGRLAGIDHDYKDSYESWQRLMFESEYDKLYGLKKWCTLSYLVAKPEAHAYVWCDIDRFHELKEGMQAAGWYVFRTPFTNYKQTSGRVPLPDMGPRRQSEWCLYAIKGKKRVNMIASDVIVTASDEQMSHGAQKPVALYEDLLRRSVRPGDVVLDAFAGTGTIIPAAHTFKCKAVAMEQNQTYYGLCLQRIADLGRQGELPT